MSPTSRLSPSGARVVRALLTWSALVGTAGCATDGRVDAGTASPKPVLSVSAAAKAGSTAPSQLAASPATAFQTKKATCNGSTKNVELWKDGQLVKDDTAIPGYLSINRVDWTLDGSGLTVDFHVDAAIPETVDEIDGYTVFAGSGVRGDATGFTAALASDGWKVMVSGPDPNASSEYVDVTPRVNGSTLSVHMPSTVKLRSGDVANFARTTHVGAMVSGGKSQGKGTWGNACPAGYSTAFDGPGEWMAELR